MDQSGSSAIVQPHPAEVAESRPAPFAALAADVQRQEGARTRITEAYRAAETSRLPALLAEVGLSPEIEAEARRLAGQICQHMRDSSPVGGVQGLIQEFDLSSGEGVALMHLAEALLRIPDAATRDALITEKLAGHRWLSHFGGNRSWFVNGAALGLSLCGGLAAGWLGAAGRPLLRQAMALGMQIMGRQFVAGRTIEHALAHSRRLEAKGFRYSYDLLGETATTAEDTDRYMAGYDHAIRLIGQASAGRGLYEGPGISVKLSALHPRYCRAQRSRVMAELYPRLRDLAVLAKGYNIGVTIDAEEAERLDLSLDLMSDLCRDPLLQGWDGLGMVVQAYQRRAPFVIDYLVTLGRETGHRLMIRLCKGAYWDSEIKRAQLDGLDDFPVFTRKVHTDVSYLACAKRLLAAPDAIFPQFATHNALTMATIHAMAGEPFQVGRYEFQGLHGMGEALYSDVVGPDRLNRPCRLYAPVGTPETLLAYLVRRLLENGANSSFVNLIGDSSVPLDALLTSPLAVAAKLPVVGRPHEKVAPPLRLFGDERVNSAGIDWSNEIRLASLADGLVAAARETRRACPLLASGPVAGPERPVANPADHRDIVGHVVEASADQVDRALMLAAASTWSSRPPADRAAALRKAADLMEERSAALLGLVVREAGKSLPNAVAEIREAVDFLRYYAAEAERSFHNDSHRPLGPVVCISPWNFPLAIFLGQVAAALVAGNAVLAKPAEETPLIAAEAVGLLHAAGVPGDALQLLPGDGTVGARLVADRRVQGVMFTGSTEVARLIQRQLAGRLGPDGRPIPLIAETGGQNAMVVDSSALPEQVVADVIQSAFDSAGQRCSALRLLCLQEDVADKILHILKGAMDELAIGNPDRLSTDVGPVITEEAAERIRQHVRAMAEAGHRVTALSLPAEAGFGTFVPPTLIEIDSVAALQHEVFGPVLHVLKFRRDDLDNLVDAINATGYGLTFGIHSRVSGTIDRLVGRINAGNIYVNRNIIGAVVGVQPFGGHGLSGTGPKAGGPLYLRRLLSVSPAVPPAIDSAERTPPKILGLFRDWLRDSGHTGLAEEIGGMAATSPLGLRLELPGPVGESNVYEIIPRGRVLCVAPSESGLLRQMGAALATGNRPLLAPSPLAGALRDRLPADLRRIVEVAAGDAGSIDLEAVLLEGEGEAVLHMTRAIADRPGPVLPVIARSTAALADGEGYPLLDLMTERSISTNTAASGNTSLATIG